MNRELIEGLRYKAKIMEHRDLGIAEFHAMQMPCAALMTQAADALERECGQSLPDLERQVLERRAEQAEQQREWAVKKMQAVLPGLQSKHEGERLQRLRDYAYTLQNRLDNKPDRYEMGYTEARLSALNWAITKISGVEFDTHSARELASTDATDSRTDSERKEAIAKFYGSKGGQP